jgi:hypothetical protein
MAAIPAHSTPDIHTYWFPDASWWLSSEWRRGNQPNLSYCSHQGKYAAPYSPASLPS